MNKIVSISEVKINPNNPRFIKDDKFKKLVQSIKDFPEMMNIRPIVVNKEMIILGGNMRFKASIEAGLKEVPILITDLTESQQKEFLIKDNVSGGDWDWDMLANEWDLNDVTKWGLDLPIYPDEEKYTTKIESPIYEPKGIKPDEIDLYDLKKYNQLIDKIEKSNLDEKKKQFLKIASARHIEFNYSKVAEYYSHEDKEMQELMEDNALVIIDYDKAIELGFVKLFDELEKISEND